MPDTPELNTIFDAPPQWAMYVTIGVLIIGAILWLLGRKIARPACAIGGLLFGGINGLLLVEQFGLSQWLFVFVVVSGVIGCLMAWFLFRIWMGMSAAIILGLAIPAALLVWQGTGPAPEKGAEQTAKAIDANDAKINVEADGEDLTTQLTRDWAAALRGIYDKQIEAVRGWWDGLGGRGQWTVMIAATAGASFGLIMGLIAPYFAAMIQTALVGGLLILGSAIHLSQSYLPDQARFLPTELRGRLLLLGLITLAGIGVQWTLSAKRTDK